MATVSNVQLTVQRGGEGNMRTVIVTYRACFTTCEARAGAAFHETVRLRGDDPAIDNVVTILSTDCIVAQEDCLERTFEQSVERGDLDEDGDTIILGRTIRAARDELYAEVELRPVEPVGDTGRSNIVRGQWGAAGND